MDGTTATPTDGEHAGGSVVESNNNRFSILVASAVADGWRKEAVAIARADALFTVLDVAAVVVLPLP